MAPLNVAANIADDFSQGDLVKEILWNGGGADGHLDISAIFSVDIPVRKLKSLQGIEGITVRTRGYQTYYGIDNTILAQHRNVRLIQESHENLAKYSREELLMVQELVAQKLAESSDEDVVEFLQHLGLHPDKIEMLSKIKGKGDVNLVLPRGRKKVLIGLFERQQEEEEHLRGAVKYVAPPPPKTTPPESSDDPFALNWN